VAAIDEHTVSADPAVDRSSLSECGRFLIAIGTAEYPALGGDASLPSVRDDLRLVARCFAELGYKRVLTEVSEDPAMQQLRSAISDWFHAPERSAADWVVFYYSGHAETDEDESRHYLLLARSRLDQLDASALAAEDLVRLMLKGSPVQQMLIILDTCYAGRGIADAAVLVPRLERRWNAETDHGVYLVAASRSREEAAPGAFAAAFTEAIRNRDLRTGGLSQPYLDAGAIIEVTRQALEEHHPHQRAAWSVVSASGLSRLIPNLYYKPGIPAGLDLESQRRHDVTVHWGPRASGNELVGGASYFTGREALMRKLVAWLTGPAADGRARVITGGPGTGKSAVLGRIVTLADPTSRQQLQDAGALTNVEATTVPPVGIVDIAVNAHGKTLREMVNLVASSVGDASLTAQLNQIRDDGEVADRLAAALAGHPQRLTIVVDALDEAAQPRVIARRLLSPLSGLQSVRLLIGSRPDGRPDRPGKRVQSLGSATIEFDLDQPKHLGPDDVANYVTRRLLAAEESSRSTPYRGRPELAWQVARAVAERAGMVFLVARIVSQTLIEAVDIVDPTQAGWAERFPREVTDAFDAYLDRFDATPALGLAKHQVIDLLMALAYAEGEGLPWDHVWAPLASALSGRRYCDADVRLLLELAGAYIVEGNVKGRSVYRLYHEALVEYLRGISRGEEIQRKIALCLIDLTPDLSPDAKDWRRSHWYVRRCLASHAAAAGLLGDLLQDPLYLVTAEPSRLLRAMAGRGREIPTAPMAVYRRMVRHISSEQLDENAAYLELYARQLGAINLIERLARLPSVCPPWSPRWVQWIESNPSRVVVEHVSCPPMPAISKLAEQTVIVSCESSPYLRISDLADGTELVKAWYLHTKPSHFHFGRPQALAIGLLGDRRVILCGGDGGSIQVYDLGDGACIGEPFIADYNDGPVVAIAFAVAKERPLIAVGHASSVVRIWDFGDGSPQSLHRIDHPLTISAMAIGAIDGQTVVVTGSGNGWLWRWDLASGIGSGGPILAHSDAVSALVIGALEDRPVVLSASQRERCVRVWDLAAGSMLRELHVDPQLNAAALAQVDGRPWAVCGHGDGTVRLWDLCTGEPISEPLAGHLGSVRWVATATLHERPVAVSTSIDGTVRVWDLLEVPLLASSHPAEHEFSDALAIAEQSGRTACLTADRRNDQITVRVRDVTDGHIMTEPFPAYHHQFAILNAIVIAKSGEHWIAAMSDYRHTLIIDLATGVPIGEPIWTANIECLAVGELAGQKVIAMANDDKIEVWDLTDRRMLTQHSLHEQNNQMHWSIKSGFRFRHLYSLGIGRMFNCDVVLTGDSYGAIRIWDSTSWSELAPGRFGQHSAISALAIGNLLGQHTVTSGSQDGTLQLQNERGQVLRRLNVDAVIRSIALAPPDTAIVATSKGLLALKFVDLPA
jgi:WD40 repeat protein